MKWLRTHRWFYWVVAVIALLLGLIGIVLPVLPTTPFIILAMWAASKCSPRLTSWIENHPKLGAILQAWQQNRAIPLFAKCLATFMMSISYFMLWYRGFGPAYLVVMLIVLSLIMAYIWSKPHK